MSCKECNTKTNKSEHLNFEERKIIERLIKEGKTKSEIATILVRDKSTIKREIRRGTVLQRKRNTYESKRFESAEFIEYQVYFADVGQRVYENNRQKCGAKNKIVTCSELVKYVEDKILSEEKWSPDTAIGYAKVNGLFENMVSTKTFYNWIDDGLVKVKNIDLHLKVCRKPKSKRRERKKHLGKSIDERPKDIENREEFGHWEGDGIVGKNQKGHLITLVERSLGIGLIFNVLDRKDDKIVSILDGLENIYKDKFKVIFKTITFDNGSEFSASESMEKNRRTTIYYAHPYSSWERAINENWNGLVRRFIPKSSSFEKLDVDDIKRIMNYINTMPRKRLGYKTPLELWEQKLYDIMAA